MGFTDNRQSPVDVFTYLIVGQSACHHQVVGDAVSRHSGSSSHAVNVATQVIDLHPTTIFFHVDGLT